MERRRKKLVVGLTLALYRERPELIHTTLHSKIASSWEPIQFQIDKLRPTEAGDGKIGDLFGRCAWALGRFGVVGRAGWKGLVEQVLNGGETRLDDYWEKKKSQLE